MQSASVTIRHDMYRIVFRPHQVKPRLQGADLVEDLPDEQLEELLLHPTLQGKHRLLTDWRDSNCTTRNHINMHNYLLRG